MVTTVNAALLRMNPRMPRALRSAMGQLLLPLLVFCAPVRLFSLAMHFGLTSSPETPLERNLSLTSARAPRQPTDPLRQACERPLPTSSGLHRKAGADEPPSTDQAPRRRRPSQDRPAGRGHPGSHSDTTGPTGSARQEFAAAHRAAPSPVHANR